MGACKFIGRTGSRLKGRTSGGGGAVGSARSGRENVKQRVAGKKNTGRMKVQHIENEALQGVATVLHREPSNG